MRFRPLSLGLATLLLAAAAPWSGLPLRAAVPAKAVEKKPLSYEAYDGWKSLRDVSLSRDGVWLVYTLAPQEGDGQVVARNLRTGQEYRHARGQGPAISADGRWMVFMVAPPKAEVDQAKKAKKKPEDMPKSGAGVMDLQTGKVEVQDRVKRFQLPKDGSRWLALHLEAPEEKKPDVKAEARDGEDPDQRARPGAAPAADAKDTKKKEPGTALVLWELGTQHRVVLPDVAEFVWAREGQWLAFAVSVKEPAKPKAGEQAAPKAADAPAPGVKTVHLEPRKPEEEGVYLWRPDGRASVPLLKGAGSYKGLAADEAGQRLAFLSSRDDAKAEAPAFKLYGWQTGQDTAKELASAATPGLPKGYAPSEHGRLDFSKDGQRLFLGTAPLPKAEPKDAPEPVKVDLWHWKDPELQPMQRLRADEEKKRSFRAVVHLAEGRLVQLGSEDLPDLEINDNAAVALGFAPGAYLHRMSWDQAYADVYALDLATGARTLLAKELPWTRRSSDGPGRASHLSPGGQYLFYFDAPARAWKVVPTRGGAAQDLTKGLDVHFEQERHDTPDLPGPYGTAGWTPGDASLLAYDRFDLWELKPGAAARNLTGGAGRAQRTALRLQRLDPEAKTVDLAGIQVLAGTQEDTKATGFFRLDGKGGAPARLIWGDEAMGGLLKAKQADAVVFTRQRFDLFPDLWASDLGFRKPTKVTDANPQQAEYRWGTQELFTYVNADGKTLKGLLAKPADFDPKKQYPLMVYIYETYSDRLHTYQAPAPGTSINFSRYASQGYLVLRPDIEYEVGYPGKSAVKCVLPAVDALIATGCVDRSRIGIQGHSWGGYQIAYLVGQTDLFKAAEAGAPVANMTSAYGGIRWGTGMSRAFQYEKTQSRIGGTPWGRPLQFIENSPVFWADRVKTPLLMIHNDDDDAVPWYQGIEYYSALRRLGREVWMFNFNGDKHNLVQRENQKYWTVHMDEFFDHLLLGRPRPTWMDTPVPYLERGKRDMKPVYGAAAPAK